MFEYLMQWKCDKFFMCCFGRSMSFYLNYDSFVEMRNIPTCCQPCWWNIERVKLYLKITFMKE